MKGRNLIRRTIRGDAPEPNIHEGSRADIADRLITGRQLQIHRPSPRPGRTNTPCQTNCSNHEPSNATIQPCLSFGLPYQRCSEGSRVDSPQKNAPPPIDSVRQALGTLIPQPQHFPRVRLPVTLSHGPPIGLIGMDASRRQLPHADYSTTSRVRKQPPYSGDFLSKK